MTRGWTREHPGAPDGWKLCTGPCNMASPLTEFHDNADHGGKDTWCKACVRIKFRRNDQIKKLDAGKPLIEPRPKRCPHCRQERKLVWDHDHSTGEFRGWICGKCNSMLGMADDDPETLRRAADSLEKRRAQ